MSEPTRTVLRHRMLREIADGNGNLVLDCVNVKQALWKPRRLDQIGSQFNLSASEARAINDLLWDYVVTPYWQGDMDVYRVLELNDAGRALLVKWDSEAA